FAQESFDMYSERFDENCTDLAIKAMTYNQDLAPALTLALFAEDKFNSSKWLNKAIDLSIWQGKMKYAVELNIKGYRKYKDIKYENYLLDKTTIDNGYNILGEIYRKKVEQGDYSFIDKVAEYFDYTAQTSQGEEYFLKLLKNHKNREILKQAISFSYKNNSYKEGLKLYYKYKSQYGIDKNLQKSSINKLIALKKFHEAYILTQELETKEKHDKKLIVLMKKLKIEDKFHIYRKLMDLGWIYKDYKYVYKLLWKLEALDELKEDGYSKLITLDQELNRGKRLAYLYQKIWDKTHKTNYLMALLYEYMDKKDYKKFELTRNKLSLKNRKILEKDINYYILLANYYAQTSKIKKASKAFATALKLDPYNSTTHQAYIWFLIDNRFNKLLKKELLLLRKNPKLQKLVGFPSVVGALQFQKTDLALKWLMPLLKSSDSLEYQVVYADILQLQDREEGASRVRLKLFRRLNQMIKKSPKLLEDKAFARVYLRLVVMFIPPEKKNLYFKKFKHLFKQKDFMDMKIGWKSYIQSEDQVKYLASKYHMNLPWLRLYIAMSRGNTQAKQELLKDYKDILAFRDRVTATKEIGDRAGAYSLAFQGMEDNQRDVDLYKIY
ncbi:MAG TPA: tetratricopeptide repeat protein, partial [Campylobacterales bacterium]|nr:tetratricopeptide repeat protein [Campylobacterales bacterium]